MSTKSMKMVLDSLIAIKASMRNVADTCVNEEIDEAIQLVEQCVEDGRCDSGTNDEILIVVGRVLNKLPSITALLKLFLD